MKLLRAPLILSGRPGEAVEDGEIAVDGTTIRHVGPRGSAAVTGGGEVIELPGCTLLPGLIDAHVHVGFDRAVDPVTKRSRESDAHLILRMAENARQLLAAGVTTARDLGARDFLDIELRDAIEAGLAVGPHLVCATRPITHSGGHCWYMGGEADTPESIRRVARENLRSGTDCLKIMATGGGMTPVGPPPFRAQYSADEIGVAVGEARLRGNGDRARRGGDRPRRDNRVAAGRPARRCHRRAGQPAALAGRPPAAGAGPGLRAQRDAGGDRHRRLVGWPGLRRPAFSRTRGQRSAPRRRDEVRPDEGGGRATAADRSGAR